MNGQWTTSRILRTLRTPIILALLVAICVIGFLVGKQMWETPLPGPATDPCVVTPMSELQTKDVVVRVYNGGTRRGTASNLAVQLKGAGFVMQDVDNSDERIKVALIRTYDPTAPEVELIAGFLPDAKIEKVNRKSAIIDVMVGNDTKSITFNAKANRKIPLPKGSACLQPVERTSASPTPTPAK